MIEVKDISFAYPGTRQRVLDGFNLSVESGRVYGLLGRNGTGKSTLLYLASGLLRPKKGQVLVDGMEAWRRSPQMLSRLFLVPEEFDLPKMKLRQYVSLIQPFYPKFNHEVLTGCLSAFDLDGVTDLRQLSMGQKKKVYMSVALAAGTEWLLMDEPTNGLDIPSKAIFRQVVAKHLSDETTLMISTHQVHDVEQLIDHVIILDRSRLLCDSSVGEITEQFSFQTRQADQMDSDVLYAEPSLQGNNVVVARTADVPETQLNLELFFSAITLGKIQMKPTHENKTL